MFAAPVSSPESPKYLTAIDSDRSFQGQVQASERDTIRPSTKYLMLGRPGFMETKLTKSFYTYLSSLPVPLALMRWLSDLLRELKEYERLHRLVYLSKDVIEQLCLDERAPIQLFPTLLLQLLRLQAFITDRTYTDLTVGDLVQNVSPVIHEYYRKSQNKSVLPDGTLPGFAELDNITADELPTAPLFERIKLLLDERKGWLFEMLAVLRDFESKESAVEQFKEIVYDTLRGMMQPAKDNTFPRSGFSSPAFLRSSIVASIIQVAKISEDLACFFAVLLHELELDLFQRPQQLQDSRPLPVQAFQGEFYWLFATLVNVCGLKTSTFPAQIAAEDPLPTELARLYGRWFRNPDTTLPKHADVKETLIKAIVTLESRCPTLGFHVAIELILERLPTNTEPTLEQQEVDVSIIRTVSFGWRHLPPITFKQLVDENGIFIARNENGRRSVGYAEVHGRRLYFKLLPELPAVEKAAVEFINSWGQSLGALCEIATIKNFPILISHGRGRNPSTEAADVSACLTLHEALLNHPKDIIGNLDEESISFLLVTSMLINPEDGKPDNYVVERHPLHEGKWRIVCIDNDRSFASGISSLQVSNNNEAILVKTILFCMDQMEFPIFPSVVRRIHETAASADFVKNWLSRLNTAIGKFESVFPQSKEGGKFLHQLANAPIKVSSTSGGKLKLPWDLKKMERCTYSCSSWFHSHLECFTNLPFRKGTAISIFNKLVTMSKHLKEHNDNVTHFDLLRSIEPNVGHRYARLVSNNELRALSVLDRFKTIDGKAFGKKFTTVTPSMSFLKSKAAFQGLPADTSKMTPSEFVQRVLNSDPAKETRELEAMLRQQGEIDKIGEELRKDNVLWFSSLVSSEQVTSVLQDFDFTKSTNLVQEGVLTKLVNITAEQGPLKAFWLKGFRNMPKVVSTLNFRNATVISLAGCSDLTNTALYTILNQAVAISRLDVSDTPVTQLSFTSSLGSLQFFAAKHCLQLTQVKIDAPILAQLVLNDCSALAKLELRCSAMTSCSLKGCIKVSNDIVENIQSQCSQLSSLNLEGCILVKHQFIRQALPCISIKKIIEEFSSVVLARMLYGLGGSLTGTMIDNCEQALVTEIDLHGNALLALGSIVSQMRGLDNEEALKRCLKLVVASKKYNINQRSKAGEGEALVHMFAKSSDNFDMLTFILSNGSEAGLRTSDHQLTSLHLACAYGNQDAVEYLLENFPDTCGVNAFDSPNGLTPLHRTTESEDQEQIVKLLLDHGADPNASNNESGITPLMLGAQRNKLAFVQALLLCDRTNLYLTDREAPQQTALQMACYFGHEQMVSMFLKLGVAIDPPSVEDNESEFGFSCLSVACAKEYFNIVKLLIDYKVDVNRAGRKKGWTALMVAGISLKREMISLLLDNGARADWQDKEGNQLAHIIIKASNAEKDAICCELMQFLASKSITLTARNAENETPLTLCVTKRLFSSAKFLVKHFKSIGSHQGLLTEALNQTCTLFAELSEKNSLQQQLSAHAASELLGGGQTSALSFLLMLRALGGQSALLGPSTSQDDDQIIDFVKMLLDSGANAQTKDRNERKLPLSYALASHSERLAKLLIEKSASAFITFATNEATSLHVAVKAKMPNIVDLILQDADVQIDMPTRNESGRTALHQAMIQGLASIAKKLLDKGANVNAVQKNDNWTPLMLACFNDHLECVECLLSIEHIDPLIIGKHGETALSLACKKGHTKIIETLVPFLVSRLAATTAPEGHTPLSWVYENPDETNYHSSPLIHAATNCSPGIVRLLLDAGFSMKYFDSKAQTSPLIAACGRSDAAQGKEIIGLFFAKAGEQDSLSAWMKAQLDARLLLEPLRLSSHAGNVELVDFLLQHGCPADWDETNPHVWPDGLQKLLQSEKSLQTLGLEQLKKLSVVPGSCPPLHVAVVGEHKGVSARLLLANVDVNTGYLLDYNALHLAILVKSTDIVSQILAVPSLDLTCRDQWGNSPLHLTASQDNASIFKLVLERIKSSNIAAIDFQNKDGRTALMIAASEGRKEIIEGLMTAGARVHDIVDHEGMSAVDLAIMENHSDCVFQLMHSPTVLGNRFTTLMHAVVSGADVKSLTQQAEHHKTLNQHLAKGWSALRIAIIKKNYPAIQALVEADASFCVDQENVMNVAVRNGDEPLVKFICGLIKTKPAKLNAGVPWSPLTEAAKAGNVVIFNTLLEAGADPLYTPETDIKGAGWTCLHTACQMKQEEIVNEILKWVSVNKIVRGPIIHRRLEAVESDLAIEIENPDVLEEIKAEFISRLLMGEQRKKKIQAQSPTVGWSALHCAVQHCSVRVVEQLLDAEADVDSVSKNGETPLMLAARLNLTDAVQLLLNRGADARRQMTDFTRSCAIAHAMRAHSLNTARLLLSRLSTQEINSLRIYLPHSEEKAPLAVSPLFACILNKASELVPMLLEKGASPDFVCESLDTSCLALAIHIQDYITFQALVDHGVRIQADDVHTAIERDNSVEIIASLVSKIDEKNKPVFDSLSHTHFGETAIMTASKNRHHDALKMLLRREDDACTETELKRRMEAWLAIGKLLYEIRVVIRDVYLRRSESVTATWKRFQSNGDWNLVLGKSETAAASRQETSLSSADSVQQQPSNEIANQVSQADGENANDAKSSKEKGQKETKEEKKSSRAALDSAMTKVEEAAKLLISIYGPPLESMPPYILQHFMQIINQRCRILDLLGNEPHYVEYWQRGKKFWKKQQFPPSFVKFVANQENSLVWKHILLGQFDKAYGLAKKLEVQTKDTLHDIYIYLRSNRALAAMHVEEDFTESEETLRLVIREVNDFNFQMEARYALLRMQIMRGAGADPKTVEDAMELLKDVQEKGSVREDTAGVALIQIAVVLGLAEMNEQAQRAFSMGLELLACHYEGDNIEMAYGLYESMRLAEKTDRHDDAKACATRLKVLLESTNVRHESADVFLEAPKAGLVICHHKYLAAARSLLREDLPEDAKMDEEEEVEPDSNVSLTIPTVDAESSANIPVVVTRTDATLKSEDDGSVLVAAQQQEEGIRAVDAIQIGFIDQDDSVEPAASPDTHQHHDDQDERIGDAADHAIVEVDAGQADGQHLMAEEGVVEDVDRAAVGDGPDPGESSTA